MNNCEQVILRYLKHFSDDITSCLFAEQNARLLKWTLSSSLQRNNINDELLQRLPIEEFSLPCSFFLVLI